MGCNLLNADALREIPNDVLDHLFSYAISPDAPDLIDQPEQTTGYRT